MFKFGEHVIIRDGSRLDGKRGIVYRVNPGEIQVLLDREVFWVVADDQLEYGDLRRANGGAARQGV